MIGIKEVYEPNEVNHQTYSKIYSLYKKLHDAFGTTEWGGNLFDVMKKLLDIKEGVK